MKKIVLLIIVALFALVAVNVVIAQSEKTLTFLQAGKGPEGIAVNPVTHKAYVVTEMEGVGKAILVFNGTDLYSPPTVIPIQDETEYITVDSTRNRIYLSTRYGLDEGEDEPGGEVDAPEGVLSALATGITLGTLTVIDGNSDTVIAVWQFAEGVEPEGVAVDTYRNIVYVGTKVPEPEPYNGTCPWGTFFIDEDGDEECWTGGSIVAFNAANIMAGPLKIIPAGDDPESVVFNNNKIYAANEDDGTVTIANAVKLDGKGGNLITDNPVYSPAAPPYGLGVFYSLGPNTLSCPDKRYEADKMATGNGTVYITDDRSRVAQIKDASIFNYALIPIDPILGQCTLAAGNDENGDNVANNIAYMRATSSSAVYVVSEQNTVVMLDPDTLALRSTITIPGALHLDAIGVDSSTKTVWITDENIPGVFILQGACANGTGICAE